MRLKLGSWAAGAEGNAEGTISWAGGKTDFNKGPFDMYVQDVSITNYNPAESYEYGDKTGSWQSIKINKGDGSSSDPNGASASSSASSTTGTTTSTSASSAASTTGANNGTTTEEPENEQTTSSSSDVPSTTATSTTKIVYSSLASVEPIDQHTEAAVSVTQTGSMYSTNTASASALNSAISAASTLETAVAASTQVPDSRPTGSTGNASWTSSAAPAEQTDNAGVSLKGGMAAGSFVGLALGVWML
jgi:hypothetical protein